jgi:hypothetical protein
MTMLGLVGAEAVAVGGRQTNRKGEGWVRTGGRAPIPHGLWHFGRMRQCLNRIERLIPSVTTRWPGVLARRMANAVANGAPARVLRAGSARGQRAGATPPGPRWRRRRPDADVRLQQAACPCRVCQPQRPRHSCILVRAPSHAGTASGVTVAGDRRRRELGADSGYRRRWGGSTVSAYRAGMP